MNEDGQFMAKVADQNGQMVNSVYHGHIKSDSWNRVVVAFDGGNGHLDVKVNAAVM